MSSAKIIRYTIGGFFCILHAAPLLINFNGTLYSCQMLHDAVFRIQHISSIELIIFTIIAIPTIYAMLGAPFVPTHMKQVKRMMHAAAKGNENL